MNFLKTFLAALLAVVVANIITFVLCVMLVVGLVAVAMSGITGELAKTEGHGSVLRIDLAQGITDQPAEQLLGRQWRTDPSNSLWEVLTAIEHAESDPAVHTLLIDVTGGSVSLANVEEIRAAIERFKERSGKRVVAWGEHYSQTEYYLASVADEVVLHPEGAVEWKGVASQVFFYKGLLDKLGVGVEAVRHGRFKSAVEPYLMSEMSPESRLQMERLVGSVWQTMVDEVANARELDADDLALYARELRVALPEDAVELELVDKLAYEDEVLPDEERVELTDYIDMLQATSRAKDRIAVLYADGAISGGHSEQGAVGSATMAEMVRQLRENDNVKGVVLRVNSPGGSALAADVMWRELSLLREKKPVIVSMGGVAASGGYYISAPADAILCDRMTITGSIGVFGLVPNVGGALRDKLGVTVETVRSEPHADMGSLMRPMNDTERTHASRGVERVYTTFVDHVAAGRNMSPAAVDSIGGGRVWIGADAVANGLADGIGGLSDAILLCADRAGMTGGGFRVVEKLPEGEGLAAVIRSMRGRRLVSTILGGVLSNVTPVISPSIENTLEATTRQLLRDDLQARMPFEVEIR